MGNTHSAADSVWISPARIAIRLLRNNPKPNSPGLDIMLQLIRHGCIIDSQNNDGETPLHTAFSLEQIECLLSFGARTDLPDNSGITPFDMLIRDEDKLKLMIKISTVNLHSKQCDVDLDDVKIKEIWGKRVPELKRYRDACLMEVTKMKEDKIENQSLFSIVSDPFDPAFTYLPVEITEAEEGKLKNKYPVFFSLIKLRFKMGVKKKEPLTKV